MKLSTFVSNSEIDMGPNAFSNFSLLAKVVMSASVLGGPMCPTASGMGNTVMAVHLDLAYASPYLSAHCIIVLLV